MCANACERISLDENDGIPLERLGLETSYRPSEKIGFDFVARDIAYANEKSSASTPETASGKPANYRNYLAKALQEDFGLVFQEDQEAWRFGYKYGK